MVLPYRPAVCGCGQTREGRVVSAVPVAAVADALLGRRMMQITLRGMELVANPAQHRYASILAATCDFSPVRQATGDWTSQSYRLQRYWLPHLTTTSTSCLRRAATLTAAVSISLLDPIT